MTHANRGMGLEALINHTNTAYRMRHMAVIHKRPTPIQAVKTKGTKILSGYFEAPSTVDYEGVYNGRSLQFEAKSTREKTRFPLDNIHPHQIDHMRACMDQGAIAFFIIEFSLLHEIFYVPGKMILKAWDDAQTGGRKSIPYEDISTICYLVKAQRGVPTDYLAIVDKHLEQIRREA